MFVHLDISQTIFNVEGFWLEMIHFHVDTIALPCFVLCDDNSINFLPHFQSKPILRELNLIAISIRKYKNGTTTKTKEANINTNTSISFSTETRMRIHKLRMTTSRREVTSTPDLLLKIMLLRSIPVTGMMMRIRIQRIS